MQSIDPKQEQRVWSRVMQADPQTFQEPTPRPTTLAQQLLDGYEAERKACAQYRAMASCACGCTRKTLQSLAAEASCDAKTFAALYFLSTSVRPCGEMIHQEPVCDLCCGLRERYSAEMQAAETYQKIAERMGKENCRVKCIAERKACAAQRLLRLIEACV
ncbi:MAG: hypothetical protein IIV87_02260 [Oscillospiraceae bacterium]|nr:hypothetical protein [Oscillospiraceae bacterium]